MMKNYQLLFLSITVALLTACGSGGSGSGSKKSSSQIATPNKPSKNLINEKETQKGNSENKPSSKPNNGEQQNNPKNETGSEINNKKEQSGNQQGNPEDEPSSKPSDSVSDNLKQAVRDSLKAKVDWDPAKGHSSLVIDGKSYNKGDFVYFSDFELGESEHNFKDTEDKEVIIKGKMKVYRLPYSVIVADKYTDVTLADNNSANSYRGFYGTGFYAGYLTKDLPETGSADYVGKSLYNDETGDFKLSVNFGKKAITSGEEKLMLKSMILSIPGTSLGLRRRRLLEMLNLLEKVTNLVMAR